MLKFASAGTLKSCGLTESDGYRPKLVDKCAMTTATFLSVFVDYVSSLLSAWQQ